MRIQLDWIRNIFFIIHSSNKENRKDKKNERERKSVKSHLDNVKKNHHHNSQFTVFIKKWHPVISRQENDDIKINCQDSIVNKCKFVIALLIQTSQVSKTVRVYLNRFFINKIFWRALFGGYLYFLYFQMNQNWVQKLILAWLWHHFLLVYWMRQDSNPQPINRESN